ncbi:AAA family ATPase [Nocardia nova]|uniref:AAA family ATPase n=1 Tax=Nocardia nova TaxID=37330 RepID=UPI0037ABD576
MYLHEIFIRNNGPIRRLHLKPGFSDDGKPLPQLIVGRNGTGKTNLLSLIGDSLMECAGKVFSDILTLDVSGRSYFRILGGKIVTYGESNSYSIFRFRNGEEEYFYREATQGAKADDVRDEVPENLHPGLNGLDGRQQKHFDISEDSAREVVQSGVYAFFPASRSEHPFWFNQSSVAVDSFADSDKYTQNLDRPLFVERGVDAFTQWLLGAITESRLDVVNVAHVEGSDEQRVTVELDKTSYMQTQQWLIWANQIIAIILDEPKAKFYWAGRKQRRKIGVEADGKPIVTSLDGLSGGQSTLLSIFGTILRYADEAQRPKGIVIIDELDAHMHIDLQMRALPKLIRFLPEIQFFISSHSPLFALGMEREFSNTGMQIVDMPSGLPVYAEAYDEFGRALEALRSTKAFANSVREKVSENDAPVIFVAGETDGPYFRAAAKKLGFGHLADRFTWIGDENRGKGGANTGDSALNAAFKFLNANPDFVSKKIIFIYDCDANKTDYSAGNLHIIGLPKIPNRKATIGIENLLPDSALEPKFYRLHEFSDKYGGKGTKEELMKPELCSSLCAEEVSADVFSDFRPTLEKIDAILAEPAIPKEESADRES